MSLETFQQAVVELTLDYRKSRALRDGDRGALVGYDLTEREWLRLLAIVRQPGMSVLCSLCRGNRLETIAGVFPMTCVLLEPVLGRLLDEVWLEHRPSNYQLIGEETAFAAAVTQRIASGELRIEYLREVFDYETVCWDLTRRLRSGDAAGGEARVNFDHPPGDVLSPLSRLMAPPAALPIGSYSAIVRLRNGLFEVDLSPPS